MDITTGKEMPLVGYNSPKIDIGLFMPVSFFMLWDLRGESFPIVNTDYRFGGLLKIFLNSKHLFSNFLSDINQDSIQFRTDDNIERGTGFRLGLYHESSHLGDELMIFAIQGKDSIDFKRINVSYEFADISYIENFYLKNGMFIQLGAGLVVPVAIMNSKLQYYDDTLLYPFHSVIAQKEPHPELYWVTDVHWNRERLWIPNFFSFELRSRDVYDYSFAANGYECALTYNAMIGWRKSEDNGDKIFLHSLGDVYVRFYYGINPHGQFRDQKHFFFFALGLRILG